LKLLFFHQVFEKYAKTKFHENPSVGDELLHADGQSGMTNLIVAFRNFAKAPKNKSNFRA